MVRKYKRKTDRQSWDEVVMIEALRCIREDGCAIKKAARDHNLPVMTLKRRFHNINKLAVESKKILGGVTTALSPETEKKLVDYLLFMENRLFGLTCKEVRQMAYDLANRNQESHPFNAVNRCAGTDWLISFRKRNPTLSLRSPEGTAASRARGFSKDHVKQFFELLRSEIDLNKVRPSRIYNIDEVGFSTCHKPPKILAMRGKKQVGSITSCDRGPNVTAVCCVSSVGHYVSPMLIFPRKRMKPEIADGAPVGALVMCQENGWIDSALFLQYLHHFVENVKPTADDQVIMLLDGHTSHKHVAAVEYARLHYISLICFPAHCTHRMQPLDVCIFGPLKTYYNSEVRNWLHNHPGRVVTQFQVASLFAKAYNRAATLANATSAFHKTGIVPFNDNIFPDSSFAPSLIVDSLPEFNETINLPTDNQTIVLNKEHGVAIGLITGSRHDDPLEGTSKTYGMPAQCDNIWPQCLPVKVQFYH